MKTLTKHQIFNLKFKWQIQPNPDVPNAYQDPYYNDDEFWYDVFDSFDLFIGDELSLDELDRLNSEFVMDYWPQIEWFLEDGGYWSKEYPECILDE